MILLYLGLKLKLNDFFKGVIFVFGGFGYDLLIFKLLV